MPPWHLASRWRLRRGADADGGRPGGRGPWHALTGISPPRFNLLVSGLAREFERNQEKLDRIPIPVTRRTSGCCSCWDGFTRAMQREPMLTEAMTRAFMFADPSAAAEVKHGRPADGAHAHQRHARGRADQGDEIAIARIIGDVWLSSLVA